MVQNFSKYTSSPATMKGLILLAFVAFCSLDGAYGEDKVNIKLAKLTRSTFIYNMNSENGISLYSH